MGLLSYSVRITGTDQSRKIFCGSFIGSLSGLIDKHLTLPIQVPRKDMHGSSRRSRMCFVSEPGNQKTKADSEIL